MQNQTITKTLITNLIRLILIITFIYSLSSSRPLIETVAAIALLTTFIPTILEKIFKLKIPSSFEIIYLMFIYGLLILGEQRGLFKGEIWWEILMTLTASIALGLVAFNIIHVLHKTNRINTNPLLASILIFAITLSLGTIWELFEFCLDTIIKSGLQRSLYDTMQDISINMLGAILVSIAGYNYIKKGKSILISQYLSNLIEKSPNLLGPKRTPKEPKEEIFEIIKTGENSKTEFKSSIRTNLYTNQFDKKMEHSILKTITAFLNTSGGNLLVGVDDQGKILGLESDKFQNSDRLALHASNLIKNHIGNSLLPFIKFQIIKIEDKTILRIKCKPSKKRVFLKYEGKEEFYIRNGPSSVKLEGSPLIEYIEHKF
jgi:uncharacterized membrane protein (DUF2068 family)